MIENEEFLKTTLGTPWVVEYEKDTIYILDKEGYRVAQMMMGTPSTDAIAASVLCAVVNKAY